MGIGAYIDAFEIVDYHTENAATAIAESIPAHDGQRLALISGAYTAAATAHDLRFMFASGTGSRNTLSAAAVSGQKDVVCTDTPKDPAGNDAADNDVCAYQLVDGTWEFNVCHSLAVKTITMDNNITGVDAGAGAAALAAGAKICIFGVVGDAKYLTLHCTASIQNKWGGAAGASGIVIAHPYVGEPFYVYSANGTNAGSIDALIFAHINK